MSDTYLLKLSGKAESPAPIKIGHNYTVTIEGSVVSETKSDNEDGTHTYTATFKPVRMEVSKDRGEMLKLRDMRSDSQIFRARVYGLWLKNNMGMTDKEFYEQLMANLIHMAPEIVEVYGPQKS